MSSDARQNLEQLEQLGPAGQWACERIIALTLENLRLRQQLDTAAASLHQLEERLEQLQQEAHRQAAPFRRPEEQRHPHPARPGRQAGHAGNFRPRPEHIDEHLHVPLEGCPHCGGAVCDKRPLTQYIEEIPVVRPHVTQLTTEEGWCAHCQKEVYSTHPLQTGRAGGAAAAQLGARALALANIFKRWLAVASIVGFGTLGGLVALHQVGTTTSQSTQSSSGSSNTSSTSSSSSQSSNNFLKQQGGNTSGTSSSSSTPVTGTSTS